MKIIKAPASILRAVCRPVTAFDERLKKLAVGMFAAMNSEKVVKGIGLAANQVGYDVRLIVTHVPGFEPLAICNPEIVSAKGEDNGQEMCLSEPGLKVWVKRSAKIRVVYRDLDGNERTLNARDLLARCIQHEIDHLNGKLLSDYAEKAVKAHA